LVKRHHLLWYKPGEGRPKEFYVSSTLFGFLIGALLFLLILLVTGALLYSTIVERAFERDGLLEENQRLRIEVQRVQRIETELRDLQEFSEQVRRSLTEGADLERILRAGEAVEQELPSGIDVAPWVQVSFVDTVANLESLDMLPVTTIGRELQMPQRWPVEGFLTRGFELSPLDPTLSHTGIDLAVPRGTPVRAVAGGIVLAADWTTKYGHRVIIDHGGVVMTVYGHNELLLVQPGDRIKANTPIALSGNSGISTAPHLHFEVWVNGRVVDPRAILPKRGGDYAVKQAG